MPEAISSRPLLDKLGVKPGARVALLGVEADWFTVLLGERTREVKVGQPSPGTDLVFLAADAVDELFALADLRGLIRPEGAIWVVSRKGKAATLRDVDVIDAAKSFSLVDNKVVSFSETHTALRLVIPVALRGR